MLLSDLQISRAPVALCTIALALTLAGCGKSETSAQSQGQAQVAAVTAQRPVIDNSVTRQQLEAGPLEPTCSLENVTDMATERAVPQSNAVYGIAKDKVVKLIGFATVKGKGEAMGAFNAYLASASVVYKLSGNTGLDRPDVVAFFGNAAGLLKSGFQIDADLRDIPSGEYAVYLQKIGGATCPTHHTIRIQ